ncbi:Nramp family divalent metal transporter [Methylobacterium sp. HMF5984]|jgi:manganese transport protein|uniref:Nramp family divalent metal transporter n=1 Tax=unclassified Methylobacterium TaxID=2615210 RepID=UPI001FB91F35|nr:Nramp family divalent metal transporter [Methylobacterium sp. J-092]MCJ2007773.1 Nramp family divalent metal transporter [Methylobacterium sp. J-092]
MDQPIADTPAGGRTAPQRDSLSLRTERRIRDVLDGRAVGRGRFLLFTGPAVMASIAYMDPGNFATNIQAGAKYGYGLLWVVLAANLVAMLFQALSAKLGIVTGRNLAELCRDEFPRPVRLAMWAVSELAAMATDLAEFLGGAIGLALLTGMPLFAGMVVTAVVTYAILLLERGGFRWMEIVIGAMVATIGLCYAIELFIAPIAWADAARGLTTPRIPDAEALTIAVGIIGATVMPHALFLHSGLTQGRGGVRNDADRRLLLRYSNREVVVALALAGLVNIAMVIMAAAAFHLGHSEVAEIDQAYRTLTPLLGPAAAGAFLVSLIASGVSSSVVGTMAGQMVMQGFLGWRVPLIVRRLATMVPAFVVIGIGVDPTRALVLSQVVLSLALPVPMIALVLFTRRPDLMGAFANRRATQVAAVAGAALVLCLNAVLLAQAFGVPVPGLAAG